MTNTTAIIRIVGDTGRWQGIVHIRQDGESWVWRTGEMAHDEAQVEATRHALDAGAVVTDVRTERVG